MVNYYIYKTSNIFYKYIYVFISEIINENNTKAIIEVFMIIKDRKNLLSNRNMEYTVYKEVLDFEKNYGHHNGKLHRLIFENLKETILWDIIYPNYKDDPLYPLILKQIVFDEVSTEFLFDLWFSGKETDDYLALIKINTRNNKLKEFLQNVFNISQRTLTKD